MVEQGLREVVAEKKRKRAFRLRGITYAKLADFMDRQNADTLAANRKGDFGRAATPALNIAEVSR